MCPWKLSMPSKGVETYTYIGAPGVEIEASVPGQSFTRRDQGRFQHEDLEVDSSKIRGFPLKTRGKFEFKVRHNGKQLTDQYMQVSALTGDAGDGTMDEIPKTRAIFADGLVINYGFYEAGPTVSNGLGAAGLPSRHQCYVTVAPDWGNWQGMVAPKGSEAEKKPFNRLVLPCPHDVGMNSMDTTNAILAHADKGAAGVLAEVVPALKESQEDIRRILKPLSDIAGSKIAPDIIASLSITQKDTLDTMLNTGARYFEFRPAHCHPSFLKFSPLPDKLYFQHGPIPGMAYDTFLMDLVHFLIAHPTEIAVVHVRWDGVPQESKRPSETELKSYMDAALALSNGSITTGSLDDLKNRTIKELRDSRKRLLYVVNVGVLSTYDDIANATTDGRSIIAAFDRVLRADKQEGQNFTVAQCQATPTNIQGVIIYSVLTSSASTMALMSTKALCDTQTLPWLRDNIIKRCKKDQLMVFMNDFLDGATTDVAVGLSRQRLA